MAEKGLTYINDKVEWNVRNTREVVFLSIHKESVWLDNLVVVQRLMWWFYERKI